MTPDAGSVLVAPANGLPTPDEKALEEVVKQAGKDGEVDVQMNGKEESEMNDDKKDEDSKVSDKEADKPDDIVNDTNGTSDGTQDAAEVTELKSKVEDLTKRLQKLEEKSKSEPKDEKSEEDREFSLDIKRMSMDEWRPSRGFDDEEFRQNVLVVYYRTMINAASHGAPAQTPSDETHPEERSRDVPQRLQINSRPLLAELEFLTGTTMSKTPSIMVPPFKTLVTNRDRIEQEITAKQTKLKRAEAKKEGKDSSAAIGPATSEDHKSEKETKKEEKVASYLKCLLDFIDTEFAYLLKLQKDIENRTLQYIAFEHLWFLYKPGDLVFNNPKKTRSSDEASYLRAFRVYHVTGGRPTIRERTLMYGPLEDGEESRPGKANAFSSEEARDGWSNPLTLDLHYMDYDGVYMGPEEAKTYFAIRNYQGLRRITDLDFFPAEFAPDYVERRQMLIDRGKHFFQLTGVSFKEYRGLSMGKDPEEVDGQVVIDVKTCYDMSEGDDLKEITRELRHTTADKGEWFEVTSCGLIGCDNCTNNYDDSQHDKRLYSMYNSFQGNLMVEDEPEKVTDDHFLLLPAEIPGFVLRSRTWKYLNVDLIHDKEDQDDDDTQLGFKELVIKKEHKSMILALVKSHNRGITHASGKARSHDHDGMDLVKGKGKGLVILLHGAPGVGKTSTAETVATYTKRPLYPITCGDIGEKAEDVEKSLEKHFKLAHRWGCVLLLDEADVFLAKRSEGDVKRNALVSVFLRTLEYYSGILFLTTNRLGSIDEAFHSRIKMTFYYDSLDLSRTMQIWANCLKKIDRQNDKNKESGLIVEYDEEEINTFARNHYTKNIKTNSKWNGRQIRNAFETALALARYDRLEKLDEKGVSEEDALKKRKHRTVRLRKRHFAKVAEVTVEYHNYIYRMQKNKTTDEMAAELQTRALESDTEAGASQAPRPRAFRQSTPVNAAPERKAKVKKVEAPPPPVESESEPEPTDESEDDESSSDSD